MSVLRWFYFRSNAGDFKWFWRNFCCHERRGGEYGSNSSTTSLRASHFPGELETNNPTNGTFMTMQFSRITIISRKIPASTWATLTAVTHPPVQSIGIGMGLPVSRCFPFFLSLYPHRLVNYTFYAVSADECSENELKQIKWFLFSFRTFSWALFEFQY